MKLYYPVVDGKIVSSIVQEDYDKIDSWKTINPNFILQEEVLNANGKREHTYLKLVDGVVEYDSEAKENNIEKQRKNFHEAAAYAQQDSFFTPNKRHLFDGVVYNAPPADMALLPKMNKYRVFMKALWTEYHTRIASGSTDYDYSGFFPEAEYSYVELEQEWADYNQVS